MTIYATSAGFKSGLQQFGKKVEESYAALLRATMIALITKIAYRTPVDTGRAAGSWSISRSQPGSFEIEKGEHSSPEAAVNRAQGVSFQNPYVVWYIYNNVPYIERLEYEGWSDQAPHGMLRLSLAEVESTVSEFLSNVL